MVANNYTGGSHRVVDKPKEEDGEMYLVHFSWPTLQIIVLIKLLYVLYNFITIYRSNSLFSIICNNVLLR